jgi:hypothetical protein
LAEDTVELATRQRMGFFGFALGVSLHFFMMIIANLVPPILYVLMLITPRYEFPWNYIMIFVTPLIWGTIFFFVPYNKSKF